MSRAIWASWAYSRILIFPVTCWNGCRSNNTRAIGKHLLKSISKIITSIPYHPGLSNFVNTNELRWEFGDWYNVQIVGINQWSRAAGNAGLCQMA